MAELRTGSIAIDGVRSPYFESGPADATEAVVFVHGNPGSSQDFKDLVARTGAFARAIAIDVPGWGKADKPHPHRFDYTAPGLGIHLSHQLDELGIERAHFVGHDFGGAFVLFAMLFRPEKVASVTFINAGILRGYRWHKMARIWRRPIIGEVFMMMTNRTAMRRSLAPLPRAFIDEMYDNFDKGTKRAVLRLYRATDNEDLAMGIPFVRALNPPAMVIWGEDDPYIPVIFAERNREGLQRAEVHVVKDAGHWPFIDKPDEVANLLLPFLQNQLSSSSA